MKKVLLSLLVLAVVFIGLNAIPRLLYTLPCERLKIIADNPDKLNMLLDKLTFFVTEPTYLSKFDSVKNIPDYPIRDFDRVDLGINWNILDVDSSSANFRLGDGKKVTSVDQLINYANIPVAKISILTFGIGARSRLVFRLKEGNNMRDYNSWPANQKLQYFDIKVECDSDSL